MNSKLINPDFEYDQLFLVGDIGGTNTTFALVGHKNDNFQKILKCSFQSQQLDGAEKAIQQTLSFAQDQNENFKPDYCCISAAGPVKNNTCRLTNLPWEIDGNQLENNLGIKTLVINDFQAISFSLPVLDLSDETVIHQLKKAPPRSNTKSQVRAVVGAGTGLGVGYIITIDGKHFACPSEGGHINYACTDRQTDKLKKYLVNELGMINEAETFISGKAIASIFKFFIDIEKVPLDPTLQKIQQTPDSDKPKLITQNAPNSQTCRQILRLFVKLYADFARNIATVMLPDDGLFVAGGIVTKMTNYFTEDDRFMKTFLTHENSNIAQRIDNIPVYLVMDYSVSLIGAANAAFEHFCK